jgi:hypothetical protein
MYSVLKTKKKRSETCRQCEKYEVPLHIPKYFKEYHTKTSFLVSTYSQYTILKIKKKSSVVYFYKYFCMDLHFYAVDRPSWHLNLSAVFTHGVFKSELSGLSILTIFK